MSSSHVDRNLLFGILALQMDFISRDALIAAMHAWVLDKQKPLGQILVEQGALTSDLLTALDTLVKKHLELHQDDPKQSLAAVGLPGGVQRELAQLSDPDVHASLARLGTIVPAKPSQATTLPMPSRAPGDVRFEILRRHAWGGLGEVFVAQDREVNREVALKRLHERCADDEGSRARFLREAEITGGLEHPGIVPVYGLGTSEDGRPHYAMRFIRGETLKEAIKRFHSVHGQTQSERRIELRQLLTRFIAVCNAVEYAHSRGVIHRDLKPSNIMLGKYGETLVVDWGLCKALGHREPEASADERTLIPSSGSGSSETLPGSAIGTPAYMSPEQSEGRIDELGPASDVYSLGATLYTILTGKEAFESTIIGVILGKVQTGDFVPPRERNPKVSRALNAICLKAMSLRPDDRYRSCAALASDVEHWLADEPVTAFQDPVSTRALRWVRRHRTAAATSAALIAAAFVSLVAGTALLGRANTEIRAAAAEAQRQRDDATKQRGVAEAARRTEETEKTRAEENARQTRRAIDRFFTLVSESRLIDLPGAEPLRKELLNAALDYYRKLPKGDSGDAEVQAELAAASFRMAIIENNTGSDNWLPEFQRGLEITERLVALNTPVEKLKSFDAGVAGDMVGRTLKADFQLLAQFRKSLKRAVELWEKLHALKPDSVGIQNDLAALQSVLGTLTIYAASISADAAIKKKLTSEALTSHTRARDLWKSLAVEFPGNPRFRADLALQYHHVGNDQMFGSHLSESLAAFREAEALGQALVRDFPQVPHYQVDLAANYRQWETLCVRTLRVRGAIDAVRQELAVREKLVADFPTVSAYKNGLSEAYENQLTLLSQVLPRLVSLRTSFLSAFDLYAELKEKQNALPAIQSGGGRFQITVMGTSFPSLNRHLGTAAFGPLKQLLDKTPKGLRAQLIDSYAERAKNGKRQGAKTYRIAAANLRWWAGDQEAAVTLLQSYAQEPPVDPAIALALVQARRSMSKEAALRAPKPAEELDDLFNSLKNPTIRRADADEIFRSIQSIDPDGKLAGPRWDALLKHEEPGVRQLALRGLPHDATQLKRFAPAIEHSLADPDAGVRAAAAPRAWERNQEADKVVPILMDCLKDPASRNRLAALSSLAAIGPSAAAVLPSLKPLLDDLDGEIRLAATLAMWRVGHDASAVKRQVADFQSRQRRDSNRGDSSWESELIGVWSEMGPGAQDALPALLATLPLSDASPERRTEILRAIQRIDPTGTHSLPRWRHLLEGENASLRSVTALIMNNWAWSLATETDPQWRDPRGAVELVQLALKKRPDQAAFWNTLGVALYRKGDWKASVAALSKSMELTGANATDSYFVAMARWQLGEKEIARKWYTAAIRWAAKNDPGNPELGSFQAEAAALLKMPDAAQVEKADDLGIADAFVEASGSAFAYHYRAAANADLGRFDRAAGDLDKVLQLGDQSVAAGYEAALARLGHNDQRGYQTACAALIQKHAQEKQPAMAHLAAWSCVMAPHALDDYGPAIGLATRAVQSDPNSATFLAGLGAVLYRAGRFDEGLKKLQQAETATQQADGDHAIAYRRFFLAMAHDRLHQASDAKKWLGQARRAADRATQLHQVGTQSLRWNQRLSLSLLRKEVEELVSKDETPHTASGTAPAGGKK